MPQPTPNERKLYGPLIACDLDDQGGMAPADTGCTIAIHVRVGHPGSKVSDIWIGHTAVQIPNVDLRLAAMIHDAAMEEA